MPVDSRPSGAAQSVRGFFYLLALDKVQSHCRAFSPDSNANFFWRGQEEKPNAEKHQK